MKTSFRIVALFLVAVLFASCGYFGFGGKSGSAKGGDKKSGATAGNWEKKPEKPKFKIPVTVEVIERDRMYAYLQAVGTVVPVKELEVKSEMSGRIYFTKKWKEGDEVKKSDVIASIDDRGLRLNINEAELNLELAKNSIPSARAELDQAKKDEQFNRAMLERGAISKAEYEQAILARIRQENSYEQTEKNIDARQMALTKLEQELEKVEIAVVFDGVLLPPSQSVSSQQNNETDLTQMEGTIIGSQAVVCRLADIDQVYVALDIPAKDLLMVRVGQDVELDVYSRIGRQYTGTVADISTTLNSNTRTYTVNVLVDNPEHEMRPGMFAKARIVTEEKKDALSIPRELVLLRNNRGVVFVAVEKPAEEIEDATGSFKGKNEKVKPAAQEKKENGAGAQLAMAGASDAGFSAGADVEDATDDEFADEYGDEFDEEAEEEEPEINWMVEEREVSLGIENRERVEVVNGLREGEHLVVLGYETLSDKVDVNVVIRDIDTDAIFATKEN
ncbi:MAG: efflux RND transporter periplasmic adaptor subunit [Candidatus Hinthialibacter antarcticus]|nr:efflux RND transporter periplasmic adaptor subunit [Candidatus Hinthialibacter antarcticus]